MTNALLDLLLTRRSVKPAELKAPGPDAGELALILTAATRVPDHKKVVPWRFIVIEGEARRLFGERLARIVADEQAETPSEVRLETERQRFQRAPVVVAVVSAPREVAGAPREEQVLSCGAACFNLCLAANALGFGTTWITEWTAYSPGVKRTLGVGDGEAIAGFIYIGTPGERQADRERPDLATIVSYWRATD